MSGRTIRAVSAVSVLAASALLLAGCSSSDNTGTASSSTPAAPGGAAASAEAGGLPFTYAAPGESSSPSFSVATSGTYSVAYHLSSDTDPTCVASIIVVSDVGTQVPIVARTTVASGKPVDATATPQLTAGVWRFQAAGGCAWKVTVTVSG